MSLSDNWQTGGRNIHRLQAFNNGDFMSGSVSPVYDTNNSLEYTVVFFRQRTLERLGPRPYTRGASNVLRIPPLGSEEASGSSAKTASLLREFCQHSRHQEETVTLAVTSGHGFRNQWVKRVAPLLASACPRR